MARDKMTAAERATLLLQAGEPVHVVSQRFGHASSVITLGVYAHALPGDQKRAACRFAAWSGRRDDTQHEPHTYRAHRQADGTWKVSATWYSYGVGTRTSQTYVFITSRAPINRSDCLHLYRAAAGAPQGWRRFNSGGRRRKAARKARKEARKRGREEPA